MRVLERAIFSGQVILFAISSCQDPQGSSRCLKLGENSNFKNSQTEYKQNVQITNDSIKGTVSFVFANNPYCLDSTYWIKLYANNIIVYSGIYSVSRKVEIPQIEKQTPVHFILEVITPERKGKAYLHNFQDKSVMSWREEYNFVYIGFFPANDETNRIHFFPQIESVIQ